MKKSLSYRSDIDGLRALAVLPVVAFHGGFERFFPGGFIGVDIFFVISGFLITRIIYSGIEDGSYSVKDFYRRRARRILPALVAVYSFCIFACLLLDFPSEAEGVSKSIIASNLFVSNILFFYSSGYFDQAMATNPLLHTWSLSVEEQFYVLFPLVVFLLSRLSPRRRLLAIAGLGLVSLIASIITVKINAAAAFYLVQYRAWELLIGSLLTLIRMPVFAKHWHAEVLGACGLCLILVSIIIIDRTTPFPGFAALGPCLGAAAIIHSGSAQPTLVAKALSLSVIRFIGRISYSLYLWHWPIIVFSALYHEPRGLTDRVIVLAISAVVSILSFFCIETPFRHRKENSKTDATLNFSFLAITSVGVVAILLVPLSRLIWNLPNQAKQYLATMSYSPDKAFRVGKCFLTSQYNEMSMFDSKYCLRLSASKKNVLIVGDSHAAHLWAGLQSLYPNINLLQATASGCKPVVPLKGEERCTKLMDFIFYDFLKKNHLDEIILSARWDLVDVPHALHTAAMLKSSASRVVISGPVPEYSQPLPRVLANAVLNSRDPELYAGAYRRKEPMIVDQAFKSQSFSLDEKYVSLYSAMCPKECTVLASDERPIQFDYGHFTEAGSDDAARLVGPELLEILPKP